MSKRSMHGLPKCEPSEYISHDKERGADTRERMLEEELEMRKDDRLHAKRLRESPSFVEESTSASNAVARGTVYGHEQSTSSTPVYEYEQDYGEPEDSAYMNKTLYYVMYVLHFGLSEEAIERMENLMGVLYGRAPPISYHHDVAPLLREKMKAHDHTTYYYCNSCDGMLEGSTAVCRNRECELFEVDVKRSKASRRLEVHVLNIIPQLEDVVANHMKEIINAHERIHYSDLDHAKSTVSRSDVRTFPGFAENIEAFEDFSANNLRILLSISTDGFKAKRITRRDMWPLYLRIDDLDVDNANKFENSILCGAIYGRTRPNDILIENLLSRLRLELESIKANPIVVAFSGRVWSITVAVYRGVADMGAQQALFGTPRWTSEFGCSKCYVRGRRVEGTRVWFDDGQTAPLLRCSQSYLIDGEAQTNGILRVTPAMRLMTPDIFSSDALHVCSEGLTKDRLYDMFNPSGKFLELRISELVKRNIKRSLLKASTHTYANKTILSIEDLPICSGSELDEVAFIIFPLSAALNAFPSPVAAASLTGYWLTLRIIAKTAWLTAETLRAAQRIAGITRSLWISMAPAIFTMKCHWFFDHGMREEMERYGTMYQWSSSPFESHHHRLQVKINQTTTNSSAVVIEKYLLLKGLRSLAKKRCSNGDEEFRKLLEVVENRHRNRFPVHILINEDMYIPRNSNIVELLNKDKGFLHSRNDEVPFSRLVIRGKIYSSKVYWKRSRSSRQDLVLLKERADDGSQLFGSILFFIYNSSENTVKVVLEELHTTDPFENLGNHVNHYAHPCRREALQVMRLIREHNLFFKRVTNQVTRSRNASDILSPACIVEYGDVRFISVL